jgi:hypothetical protein
MPKKRRTCMGGKPAHTSATRQRTTNRDHAKRQQRPMMEDEVVAAQLEQLVTPAVLAQEKYGSPASMGKIG